MNTVEPPVDQIEFTSQLVVGMADFAVSADPNTVLCTNPLGACLGIIIYDPAARIGGLLHSLLPASSIDPDRAAQCPGMFLDSGLAAMLARALALKAKKENLLIYAAGGAQIMEAASPFNLGRHNYETLAGLLAGMDLKLHAEDVGGRSNRSMQIHLGTGEVRIKYSGQEKLKMLCKR